VITLPTRPRSYTLADIVVYLVGIAGLAFAMTSIWLGMRSVMDIGGSCGSGGPYEIAVQCPANVDVVMTLAFPLGFLGAGLIIWKGSRLGAAYVGLVALAWPALFLSLGWNFLEYAFRPPDGHGGIGEGIELGWLIPGVIFVIMGGVPLIGWIAAKGHGRVVPGIAATQTPVQLNELSRAMREVARNARRRASASSTVAEALAAPEPGTGPAESRSLVAELERLASLHDSRALTDAEYDQAKLLLLSAASKGQLQ
jgi:hypothetical protein